MEKNNNPSDWEDKEIRFDVSNLYNQLRNGEMALCILNYVEDSKGNLGDTGKLLATNLRIIWHSLVNKKFNITIGYALIIKMTTKAVFSKVRGTTQALCILAFGGRTRFEFLFTDVSREPAKKNSTFFNIFQIYRLYQRTFLYRDIKFRGAIVQSGQLVILPQEQVYSKLSGVWNLSSDQGNLGSFVVTNIRLVWFADVNEIFNISLPYRQITNIRIRESKYGPALVVQTSKTGGSYVLGFRIDPPERLNAIYKELRALYIVFSKTPNFGVNYVSSDSSGPLEQSNLGDFGEFQEIDEKQEREVNSKLNAYISEECFGFAPREPVYCQELGFAMEQIREGYKLKDLWEVMQPKWVKIND